MSEPREPQTKRRRFRFSLRGLLALTFAVSIFLAWVAYFRHQSNLARNTLRQVRELGGRGHYLASDRLFVLQALLGREPRTAFIDFPATCEFSDDDLESLQKLRDVPGLSLQNTAVTRDGLAQLTKIPGLKQLDLRNTLLDDTAAKWLGKIQSIETLDVRGTAITDEGMKDIARLANLKALHVDASGVSDEGVLALAGHKRLEFLNLSDSRVTDRGIVVAAQLPKLRTLFFARTEVTNEGLKSIQSAPSLQVIALNESQVGGDWISLTHENISWRPYGTTPPSHWPEVFDRH